MTSDPSGRRAKRVGVASLLVLLLTASLVVSCTSATAEFCGELSDSYTLDDLTKAISEQDAKGTQESLQRMRDIQDTAPAEIHDDFRNIVDVLTDLVRIVTDAPGPEGQDNPVNPDELNRRLAEIQPSVNNVTDFADEKCGINLK